MKQFEYFIISAYELNRVELNKLGSEGWELVAFNYGWAYFKRIKTK